MLVVSRGALLATTASLAAGLLTGPGVAYAADTSTPLSAAEMAADLTAVSTASAQAAAGGWKATVKMTGDSLSGSEFAAADPVAGVAVDRYVFGGLVSTRYSVVGKGSYFSLVDPGSLAAVKMMRRPSVRYVFEADKSNTDLGDGMSPGTLLTGDVYHAGTKTVHDDGSADYRLSRDGTTTTAHVTAAGTLASADSDEDGFHAKLAYAYGPQHVTPPSASVTIGADALDVGLAYLEMATSVKQVAGAAATDALEAAGGHKISMSSLWKATQQDVQAFNDDTIRMIKAKRVGGGVRVYATNPWTHRTVAYTLTPSGRRVTIAKS